MQYIQIITIMLITLYTSLVAENPDTTFAKVLANKSLIEKACREFRIEPVILSAVIFVERTENYSWEDSALDNLLAYNGLNSSIGFCQVKIKTAYWIEAQYNDTNSILFPGKEFYAKMKKSNSTQKLVEKLNNDTVNINYAAAYIRTMMSRWEKTGFSINDKPEILGTLYSTGLFYSSGRERLPHAYAVPNDFGIKVLQAIEIMKELF